MVDQQIQTPPPKSAFGSLTWEPAKSAAPSGLLQPLQQSSTCLGNRLKYNLLGNMNKKVAIASAESHALLQSAISLAHALNAQPEPRHWMHKITGGMGKSKKSYSSKTPQGLPSVQSSLS